MRGVKSGTTVIAFLAIIAMAIPGWAQSTGAIQGSITDAQGAVVPGTTITVRNVATGVERSTVTDASGDYLAPALAPGRYRVEARLVGLQRSVARRGRGRRPDLGREYPVDGRHRRRGRERDRDRRRSSTPRPPRSAR